MMVTLNDLLPFCCEGMLSCYDLSAPYLDGEYTMATDGRILVRCSDHLTDVKLKKTPDLSDVFLHDLAKLEMLQLPVIEKPSHVDDRWQLNVDDFEFWDYCEYCYSTVRKAVHKSAKESVVVGNAKFGKRYLWLINQLPNALGFAVSDRLYFVFDGGDGVLMSVFDKSECDG